MLSILIPVYNWDITKLVTELHRQCSETDLVFEILCYDDGSEKIFKSKNQRVGSIDQVFYKELPENLGRSKIRNVLGKAAKYDYLLFMDCDSGVISPDYIQNYLFHLKPDTLLYGGRVYQDESPSKEYFFHWYYGKHREQVPFEIRRKTPYHSFMTNNFLIPKAIFLNFLFDENLKQYGHEDTIFGLQLKAARVPILHLDNPLLHEGLEKTDDFLLKTRQGLENLLYLSKQYKEIDTRLLRMFKKVSRLGLSRLLLFFYKPMKNQLLRNFHSSQPNLKLFDFYKLGYLLELSRKTT